jgi:periplasmic divalent cation tolerance protein
MSETLTVTTCATRAEAKRLARALVKERLAACVTLLPGAVSIYAWKGKVEESAELVLLIKSTSGASRRLEARLKALHAYEVPEVLTFRASGGSAAYLRWIRESVR